MPDSIDTFALTDWSALHGDHFADRHCLVTGGAGFIGSHLTLALLRLGASVSVLDDLSGGSWSNLSEAAVEPAGPHRVASEATGDRRRLSLWEGSIGDAELLRVAGQDATYVFHLAALGSVPRSIRMPERYLEVNISGTMNVLEMCRQGGVRRLVFSSSSSVYGETEELPKHESMPMLALSPYAASKISGEALVRAYAKCYDFDAACLRYFNVFGPRQNGNSAYAAVIAAFAECLKVGRSPTVYGDGQQSRDFTYVDNVVHANLSAARQAFDFEGTAINVACGRRVTVAELADQMKKAYGLPDLPVDHQPQRRGDIRHSLADLRRAADRLDYQPVVDFERGLGNTIRWYRQSAG